jgi:hypothetical protein
MHDASYRKFEYRRPNLGEELYVTVVNGRLVFIRLTSHLKNVRYY